VEVVQVVHKDVPIYEEWIGTLDGLENADVQGAGHRLSSEASLRGRFLREEEASCSFRSIRRPFQASLDSANALLMEAQAQLANAEASQLQAQLNVDKYTPLAAEQVATQQDLDNAVQTNVAAKATVVNSKAGFGQRRRRSKVLRSTLIYAARAPIDGIAGQAQLQVGALVNSSTSAVTTVSTVDPIKVFFTVSEQEYLAFNRQHRQKRAGKQRKSVRHSSSFWLTVQRMRKREKSISQTERSIKVQARSA